MRALLSFWIAHRAELASLFGQHVLLVAGSTVVAVALGVPLGVFAARRPRLASPLMAAASVVQTIPSLAMFGFLLPVPFIGGVGARAAVVVLILYGLLPIVRTTIAGLRGIDPSIREAGIAMGMTPRELLRQVELPLALPSIVAGVRVAAVVAVGSATIAAAIGAGGLGEYIYRGLSMVDTTVILAGAVPAAALALIVDAALLWLERQLSARRRSRPRRGAVAAALVAAALVVVSSSVAARRSGGAVIVGSKNFTEQLVLGELLAQTIERDAGLQVDRRLNLGGTLICDRALMTGDIDVYVEYTGTALTAVFHQPVSNDAGAVFETVRTLYAKTGRTLLAPLGFNNTFAILVRGADARSRGLATIDDAARESPRWRAGFGYEFVERPDGYPGLAKAYGMRFPDPPRVMDLTLSYRALAAGQVDLIAGDATAGLIKGLDLFQLEDNRHYFPPYDATAVARAATLLRYPQLRAALEGLSGRVSAADMRAMNYAADVEHRDVPVIVREFLARTSLMEARSMGMRFAAAVVAIVVLALGSAGAAAGTSVLFIGNSFLFGSGSAVRFYRADTVTDLNNEGIGGVPALFKSFSQQAGLDYDVSLETRGGAGLDFHLENKLGVIGRRGWDTVVMHGFSTLDADNPRDPAKLIATSKQMADFLRGRNPKVALFLMATWSRADETYPAKGAWAGQPIEAMARDVRAAYDKAAAGAGVKAVIPVGEAWTRAIQTGVADPNPYDGIEAGKLNLWTFDKYHASAHGYYLEALVIFGTVTGRDPRSLGDNECSGYELGISRPEVKALQQVAFDQLAAAGTVTAAPLVLPKGVNPERCVGGR